MTPPVGQAPIAPRRCRQNKLAHRRRLHRAGDAQPFALAYLDLDGFKQVNDARSHEAGDEVLRALASRLLAGVRTTGTIAQRGGDKFVLLLPVGANASLSRIPSLFGVEKYVMGLL